GVRPPGHRGRGVVHRAGYPGAGDRGGLWPARRGGPVAYSIMSAAVSAFHRYRRRVAWHAAHGLWRAVQRAGAISPGTPGAEKFAAFGAGSIMGFPTGALYGERWIEIGAGTMIGAQVSLSAGMFPGQDLGEVPLLRIGERCPIRRGGPIVAPHSLRVRADGATRPSRCI